MKNKIFYLTTTFIIILASFFSGCFLFVPSNNGEVQHVCLFEVEDTSPKYLKEEATCTTKAKYFYSCDCGNIGEETFEYGEPNGHGYNWEYDQTHHWKEATCGCEIDDEKALHEFNEDYCEVCFFENPQPTEGLEYALISDYYEVVGMGSANTKRIVIPETHKDLKVKSIRENAFKNKEITSLVIGDNVETIGANAFYYCKGLTKINLGKNLKVIKENAFAGLTAFDMPVSSQRITMYDSIEKIEKNAFHSIASHSSRGTFNFIGDINSYLSIDFDNKYSIPVKNYDFYLNGELLEHVVIDKAEKVPDWAFIDQNNIKSYTIGTQVKYIGQEALSGNYWGTFELKYQGSLEQLFNIEKGTTPDKYDDEYAWTATGYDLYIENQKITKIDLSNLQIIPQKLLPRCNSLEEVITANNLLIIEEMAFLGCSSLKKITLPDSVTYIGKNAFYECESLQFQEKDGLKYLGNENNKFLFLYGLNNYEITSAIIAQNCKFISNVAFWFYPELVSVEIPDSVTNIHAYTFNGCQSLENISFNGNIEKWNTIDKQARWIDNCPVTFVQCLDGKVYLSAN